jgi:PAS domain S-box-containing protein
MTFRQGSKTRHGCRPSYWTFVVIRFPRYFHVLSMRRKALDRLLLSDVTSVAVLAIAYILAGKLGLKLAFVNEHATAIWPPTAIALAGLLLGGYRLWPGVLIGAFLVNVTTGDLSVNRILASIAIGGGNTLEALLGAYLVNRGARGTRAFERARDVCAFAILAAILSTTVSATVGVTSLLLTGLAKWANASNIWITWWIGDAGADLVFVPALILWATEWRSQWTRARMAEAGLTAVGLSLLFVSVVTDVFSSGPADPGLVIVCIPPLLWVAFRLGKRAAATAMLLLSCIAVWGATHDLRIGQHSPAEVLVEVQAYLAITSVMVSAVAAEVSQRRHHELEQQRLAGTLREHVQIVDLACVLVRDIDDRITRWSSGAESLYGFTSAEAVGRISHELFRTRFPEPMEQIRDRLFAEGRWSGELQHETRDGRDIVVASLQVLARDKNDRVAAVLEVNNDVTEQKRAEEELRAAQKQLELITDNMAASVARCSHDRRYLWVSRGYAVWLGRPAQEIAGRPIVDVIGSEGYAVIRPHTEEVLSGKRVEYEAEVNYLGTGRRWIHAVYVPTYDRRNEVDGWIAVVTDITERRRAEERFRLAVQAAPNGMVLADEGGKIVLVNSEMERLFGYRQDEMIGRPVEILVPREFRNEHLGYRQSFYADPQARPMGKGRDLRARRKDGSEFPVEIGLNPIETSHGVWVLSAIVDITERKRMEQERLELITKERTLASERALREMEAELARIARALTVGELAASIAHEVNQPLAGVVTNAEAGLRWLGGETPNIQEVKESLAFIVRDGNRASAVIQRIREFLKKENQGTASVDINETIQEAVALAHAELEKSQIELRVQLASRLPRVQGDRVQLQQVILNLMMNGRDAMVAVADGSRGLVLTSRESDGGVLVTVRDSGHGIEPQDLNRMFDAFFTTKPHGMGMGLSISRSIVEAHGGRIWAERNDGPGLTVQFSLPAQIPNPQSQACE